MRRAEYDLRVEELMSPGYLYTPAMFERERTAVLLKAGIPYKKNRRAFLALILTLAGCGSSSQPPTLPPNPAPGPETLLVTQPATIPNYSNAAPPRGTTAVILWGPVEKLPSPPTNATSADGVLDIVIDSASIPGNVAARHGLGTIVLAHSFKTAIRATQYRYTYDLKVPRADHANGSVAQVVAYLNLRDKANGTYLWLGQIAFDTRCGTSGHTGWDQGTNTPVYNIVASGFSCSPYNGWRSFTFVVGPAEIGAAAAALRKKFPAIKLSGNPGDYEVTHINLNPETAAGQARIDVGIKNWQFRSYQ